MSLLVSNNAVTLRFSPLKPGRNLLGRVSARCLFNWGANRTIYPPSPSSITTRNRLYPTYIVRASELQDIVLTKDPLFLNFTYQGDQVCNKLTLALFDKLAYREKCPLDSKAPSVELANIACDSLETRDLMLTYAVSEVPTIVCLYHQIPIGRYTPSNLKSGVNNTELDSWIKDMAKK